MVLLSYVHEMKKNHVPIKCIDHQKKMVLAITRLERTIPSIQPFQLRSSLLYLILQNVKAPSKIFPNIIVSCRGGVVQTVLTAHEKGRPCMVYINKCMSSSTGTRSNSNLINP